MQVLWSHLVPPRGNEKEETSKLRKENSEQGFAANRYIDTVCAETLALPDNTF